MRRAGIAVLALVLSACAGPRAPAPAAPASDPVTACTEPRPQVCTMIYAPVCATLEDGSEAGYASPCNACADAEVQSWREGSCDDDGAGPT